MKCLRDNVSNFIFFSKPFHQSQNCIISRIINCSINWAANNERNTFIIRKKEIHSNLLSLEKNARWCEWCQLGSAVSHLVSSVSSAASSSASCSALSWGASVWLTRGFWAGATGPLLVWEDSGCSALASVTEGIGNRYVRMGVRGSGFRLNEWMREKLPVIVTV